MKFIVFFSIYLSIFISCNQKQKDPLLNKIEGLYGQKLKFKDLTDSTNIPIEFKEDCLKIIEFIDSIYCVPCKLEKIKIWKHYESELKKYNIKIILITNNTNHKEMMGILKELNITYPVYFDDKNYIKRNNEIIRYPKFQIFTINTNDEIIWIGSPIQNDKSWKLYKKFMREIIPNS